MSQRSPYYSLFHPRPLSRRVNSFGFPRDLGDRFLILQKWLRFASDGQPSNLITEAQFLHDIFVDILGYRSPFETAVGTWELELHPTPALGFFTESQTIVIAEIRVNSAKEGAIVKPEAEHDTTEWLIVLDYRDICLYHRQVSGLFCQRFAWDSLTDLEQLKAFYLLLSRRTLLQGIVNGEERSRTSQLLDESHQLELELIKNFYSHYYKIRSQLIKDFRYRLQLLSQVPLLDCQPDNSLPSNPPKNPNVLPLPVIDEPIAIAIYQAQKLLNRIIFVAYCEDCQILPTNTIKDAYEFINPYLDQPVWENYKAIFRWIEQGNSQLIPPINAYPIALFAKDQILDQALFVGDELCRQIKEITKFDFSQDLTQHILMSIFDESIRELAQYHKDLSYLSKRRTPKLPCKSVLQSESVIKTLQSYFLTKIETPPIEYTNNLDILNYCQQYHEQLLNIKILHPKCGAGVFLITALEFLLSEHERIHYLLTKFAADTEPPPPLTMAAIVPHILQYNLFGCDLTAEAVEMARLSLCLRSLEFSLHLPNFEQNIQIGDISSCDFGTEFHKASDRGDVIVLK